MAVGVVLLLLLFLLFHGECEWHCNEVHGTKCLRQLPSCSGKKDTNKTELFCNIFVSFSQKCIATCTILSEACSMPLKIHRYKYKTSILVQCTTIMSEISVYSFVDHYFLNRR